MDVVQRVPDHYGSLLLSLLSATTTRAAVSFFHSLFCPFPRTPIVDPFTTAMASDALSAHVMQALEVYTKGTKAWFEDDKEAWVSASVKSKEMTDTNVRIVFQDDEDESRVSQRVYPTTVATMLISFYLIGTCL